MESEQKSFDLILKRYMDYNAHTNISAIREEAEVIEKQFLDSLAALSTIESLYNPTEEVSFRILDLGSGGGFPAIPLALCLKNKCPKLKIYAVESIAKKTKFIASIKEELGLDNLEIITERIEPLAHDPEFRERVQLVTARSLANLPSLLEYAIPFLEVGAKLISYKSAGIDEEMNSAAKAFELLHAKINESIEYSLPSEESKSSRQILVIEKTASTDAKYPRGNNKPVKSPL